MLPRHTRKSLALLACCSLTMTIALAQSETAGEATDPAPPEPAAMKALEALVGDPAITVDGQRVPTDTAPISESADADLPEPEAMEALEGLIADPAITVDGPLRPADMTEGIAEPEIESVTAAQNLRRATYERMVRLLKEKRYPEAKAAAQAVVTLTEQEAGPDSLKLASPLDNLATTQMLNGDLVDAVNNYQRSIALIKQAEGMLSPRLVNPYIGLGATFNRAELYEKAEETYLNALRINHVNEGFYNLGQIRIRDGLTETFIGLDDFEEADFHQTIQLEISQRRFGEDNPEVAPAMYKLARWYERAGLMEEARYTYQRAQSVIRRSVGKDSPEMIAALEGLAGTYERQGLLGESAGRLKKALKIVESRPNCWFDSAICLWARARRTRRMRTMNGRGKPCRKTRLTKTCCSGTSPIRCGLPAWAGACCVTAPGSAPMGRICSKALSWFAMTSTLTAGPRPSPSSSQSRKT